MASRAARFFPLFGVVASLLICALLLEVGLRLFWESKKKGEKRKKRKKRKK